MMNSTPTLACSSFFGGNADGAVSNLSPVTLCPSFFGNFGDGQSSQVSSCFTILPVRRIHFYGEKQLGRNQLYWTLSDGFQPRLIDIEKSTTGNTFMKIGTLPGNNDPVYLYPYTDVNPGPKQNYYRLRITEWNNAITYSQVLLLSNSVSGGMNVYPNPSSGFVTLYYLAERAAATRLQVWQYDWRLVRVLPLMLSRGHNYISLDLQSLSAGIYFISIGESGERVKLVVGR